MPGLVKVGDITPAVLQEILRRSLSSPSLHVTDISEPESLGGINDGYASDLTKIEVTFEDGGKSKTLHLVAKAALDSFMSWLSVLMGGYIFYKESFWFDSAFPELLKLVSAEQRAALLAVMPRAHYAYCNYQEEDLGGCVLSRPIACCFCLFLSKPKEKGVILMENLKEGGEDSYLDLKEIERTSGGGVKTAHMRLILEGLAHFHGAWMVWLSGDGGMGHLSREEVKEFYKPLAMMKWKWMWKWTLKKIMRMYITLAEANKDDNMKEKMTNFLNAPESVDNFMKVWEFSESKFKTICHNDLWTSQIMMSLHEDGKTHKKQ